MESTRNLLKLYVSASSRPVHEALSNKLYSILGNCEGDDYAVQVNEWIATAKWLGLLLDEEVGIIRFFIRVFLVDFSHNFLL